MPKYYIHDNGGRPFEVIVSGKKLIVRKMNYDDEKYEKIVLKLSKFIKLFVGKCSTSAPECKRNVKYFDGNSLLIHVTGKQYIFIGAMIIQFTTLDHIKHYNSPIGDNDVPYPFAVGDEYTYLLGFENVVVPNKNIIGDMVNDAFYPYTLYYYLRRVMKDKVKMFGFTKLKQKVLVKRS